MGRPRGAKEKGDEGGLPAGNAWGSPRGCAASETKKRGTTARSRSKINENKSSSIRGRRPQTKSGYQDGRFDTVQRREGGYTHEYCLKKLGGTEDRSEMISLACNRLQV